MEQAAEWPRAGSGPACDNRSRPYEWATSAGLLILIIAVYYPACRFGFTNWDDLTNFFDNPSFRGLTPAHWRWFFTTYHMGHYQPLNWLIFAADYSLWGLSPERFHFTQIVLHAVAVVCVYGLIRTLLDDYASTTSSQIRWACSWLAAALFGVHPLRVESAAWLSARTDILATIFGCLCVTAYLRWISTSLRRWWWISLGLFVLALLSKEMAVTIPLICLVLKLGLTPTGPVGQRLAPTSIRDLLPFFVVSIVAGVNAMFGAGSSLALSTSMSERGAQMVYSYCFYVFKTLWPVGLSPLYEFPGAFGWSQPEILMDAAILLAVGLILVLFRRPARGVIIAVACYLILLLPVSGIAPRGPQLVADRYSYIGTIPLFVLLAFGLAYAWRILRGQLVVAAALLIAICIGLSRVQLPYWNDPIRLWNRAIALDSHNGTAHANLGQALEMAGRDDEAILEYQRALRIRPTQPNVHRALAAELNRQGRLEEALAEYVEDVRQNPGRAASYYYLGTLHERLGRPDEAADKYRAALSVDSSFSLAEVGLARLLLQRPDERQAEPHLRRALDLDGRNTEALELLAQVCRNTGRIVEAEALYDRLIAEASHRGRPDVAKELATIRAGLSGGTTTAPTRP